MIRRRPLTALALALGMALPAAAAAEPVFSFTGRGWGHGVGMSQYGARGAALAGLGAAEILAHYYRGTELTTIPEGAVRVLLRSRQRQISVTSANPWQAVDETADPPRAVPLRARLTYTVRPDGAGGVVVQGPRGGTVARMPGQMRFQSLQPTSTIALGRARYRGAMRIVPAARTVSAVNVVDIEQYLYGVVPREMPASWGNRTPAALEAQAIAARTYAVATMRQEEDYDLMADTRSQVYGGVGGEDRRSTAAVDATRGQVVTYQGEIVTTYYFSTSGGRTEDVQNVFSGSEPAPYLVGVEDPWDQASPYHARWPEAKVFSASRLGRLLGAGAPVARIDNIVRGASPRVVSARVVTRGGRAVTLSGARIRTALGLRDTWFFVTRRAGAAAASRPSR